MQPTFPAFDERDQSLETVLENAGQDWKASVIGVAKTMDGELIGETIRKACEAHGLKPHHPNAWGAIVSLLVKRGVLRPTGQHQPMREPRSHARMTPVYVVVK
jgi:hypothetical protein